MKTSLRTARIAGVLGAFVLIAAACGDSSSEPEQAPLVGGTEEPASLPPNDRPGDRPAIA